MFNFLSDVYNSISSDNIKSISYIFSQLSFLAIGIVVTIFVFTVTLLGRATKLAKENKSRIEQKNKADTEDIISELKAQLSGKSPNTKRVLNEVLKLETKQKYNEKKLNEIEKKYKYLGLKDGVINPSIYFVLSIITQNVTANITGLDKMWQICLFSVSFITLFFGVKKVIATLNAIEEVSTNTDGYSEDQIARAVTKSMRAIENEKTPHPFVKFYEKPPFVFKANSNVSISFRVDLKSPGGAEAKNVRVWLLFSPEIKIKEDDRYKKPFVQSGTFKPLPNANTVIYEFNSIKKHILHKGKINIETPSEGNYKMLYSVECDNYSERINSEREIGIIVNNITNN